MTEEYLKTGISSRKLDTSDVSGLCFDRGVLTYKKNPSQNVFQEGFAVLRTGIEPVRALLPTGFSCYSCFYTSRLHP